MKEGYEGWTVYQVIYDIDEYSSTMGRIIEIILQNPDTGEFVQILPADCPCEVGSMIIEKQ